MRQVTLQAPAQPTRYAHGGAGAASAHVLTLCVLTGAMAGLRTAWPTAVGGGPSGSLPAGIAMQRCRKGGCMAQTAHLEGERRAGDGVPRVDNVRGAVAYIVVEEDLHGGTVWCEAPPSCYWPAEQRQSHPAAQQP